jgi:hypothetical protein
MYTDKLNRNGCKVLPQTKTLAKLFRAGKTFSRRKRLNSVEPAEKVFRGQTL